jgi:hypothetical protein
VAPAINRETDVYGPESAGRTVRLAGVVSDDKDDQRHLQSIEVLQAAGPTGDRFRWDLRFTELRT